ncbi:transposable element Tcb1 transposase [Trichonephila clavipes]|nr:transposable element Tcb1 transposase [Trichonephila clavipes]
MCGRNIGKIEEGRKITDVAKEFDIAHSVVSRLWKSFKSTGMCSRRHGGGRVRSTTPAEYRHIVLSAKMNRRTTAQQVANKFLAPQESRSPEKLLPDTEQDWACVLFSDESRFSLSSDCRSQQIWRESGTAYRPEYIQEKDRYPTCSIMVWAGIMINGRTRLHVVANGTTMGQRYIDEVLLPHVRLFRGAVGGKFVFTDDMATCHRTFAVQDCVDSEGIQRLVWPVRSPDLNLLENVWDALGRQIAGRNYPPTNKNTLIRLLTEEWDKLPQQLMDNVVQTASTLVRLVDREEGWEAPDHPQGILPLNWDETEKQLPGQEYAYKSIDCILDSDEAVQYPIEFLSSIQSPKLQAHNLLLKMGTPIILIRNIDTPRLCNGSRLIVKKLMQHFIQATVLAGCAKDEDVFSFQEYILFPQTTPYNSREYSSL